MLLAPLSQNQLKLYIIIDAITALFWLSSVLSISQNSAVSLTLLSYDSAVLLTPPRHWPWSSVSTHRYIWLHIPVHIAVYPCVCGCVSMCKELLIYCLWLQIHVHVAVYPHALGGVSTHIDHVYIFKHTIWEVPQLQSLLPPLTPIILLSHPVTKFETKLCQPS